MDCEAVDENGVAFLSSCVADSLQEDESEWCLWVVEARVVAAYDVVENDVYVGDLVGVKRCDQCIWVRDQVTFSSYFCQDATYLNDLGLVEGMAGHGCVGILCCSLSI